VNVAGVDDDGRPGGRWSRRGSTDQSVRVRRNTQEQAVNGENRGRHRRYGEPANTSCDRRGRGDESRGRGSLWL